MKEAQRREAERKIEGDELAAGDGRRRGGRRRRHGFTRNRAKKGGVSG
jgi:hypothetical protein